MIPAPLRDFLPDDMLILGGRLAKDDNCEGSRHHSPTPLVLYYTPLRPEDEPGEGPHSWLCGTCRSNLIVFTTLLQVHRGDIPWEVQRQFGNMIRELAYSGHPQYRRITHA